MEGKLDIARSLETLDAIAASMRTADRTFFSRWGDGEVGFMAGMLTKTPEEMLTRKLRFDLLAAYCIQHQDYLRSVSGYFKHEEGFERGVIGGSLTPRDQLEGFVLSVEPETTAYLNPIAFNYAVVFEQAAFVDFLDTYVRPQKTMFVGSAAKASMERVFGPIAYHVEVPPTYAYQSFGEWFPEVVDNVDDVELVAFSAGMSTNVAMGMLWNCGFELDCVDFGSFVDALEGRGTRAYIRKYGDRIRSIF